MDTLDFQSDKKFFDDVNFPYGIERSGDFTRQQADILLTCGRTLEALENGSRLPETQSQQDFVLVVEGKKPATTEVERVWAKYKTVVGGKGRILSLNSATGVDTTLEEE